MFLIYGSIAAVFFLLIGIGWSFTIGPLRASLALCLRLVWLIPFLACLFPKVSTEPLHQSNSNVPIYILVDDSQSMKSSGGGHEENVKVLIDHIVDQCSLLGCSPRVLSMSESIASVRKGYTPLNDALNAWQYVVGTDPWVLLTDGGDSTPSSLFSRSLANWGARTKAGDGEKSGADSQADRGLILGFVEDAKVNLWISKVEEPAFAFQESPIKLRVHIARSHAAVDTERVQLQALLSSHLLASTNVSFSGSERHLEVELTIPPLERGQHLLNLKLLPVSDEKWLWDNQTEIQIEVLANTIGALHLLGSPSWDGRFVRRLLKSEPKFDLISFFILRDPWDSQQVNERELSLIPFPVKRLFEDELPNFRLVVLQNFALHQFLEPQFQQNLVNFVKNGGSMLFMGGPRALQSGDLGSSALGEILPFDTPQSKAGANQRANRFAMNFPGLGIVDQSSANDPNAPVYEEDLSFRVQLAKPTQNQRALANVFDDWQELAPDLMRLENLKGLHRVDRVNFRKGASTPLLNAKLSNGKTIPLAVASYPGNGRALWLFSDSWWRLAMAPQDKVSRQNYNKFFGSAFNWLLRDEVRKSLVAKDLNLRWRSKDSVAWSVDLRGQALKYFSAEEGWEFRLCGLVLKPDSVLVERVASEAVYLSGQMNANESTAKSGICKFEVIAQHAAFGRLTASVSQSFPKIFSDAEIGASQKKLEELAHLTRAPLINVLAESETRSKLSKWLEDKTQDLQKLDVPKFRTVQDFYWIFDHWLIWLCLLALPLEVLVRRWHVLFGR